MTRYRTIVADPPWPVGDFPAWYDEDRRSAREREIGVNPTPYGTMSLEDIKALPVREISPGPYLELFARRDRLGWDTWGNESLGTAEMDAA